MARFPQSGYTFDFEEGVASSTTEVAPEYFAFPSLAEATDGTIVVVYMRATDHATTRDGAIKFRTSSDGGATFSAEGTVYDEANDLRDPGLVCLANGDLLCSFTRYNTATDYTLFVSRSTDNGATWAAPVEIAHGLTDYGFICGRIIQLPNGDLLAPLYGRNTGATYDSAAVSRSIDNGATWAHLAVIRDGETWTRHAQEPCLAYDADLGRVWCMMRSDGGGGANDRFYLFYSDDSGATWITPGAATLDNVSGKPAVAVTREGAMVVAFRNRLNANRVGWAWSYDDGATWSARQTVNSNATYEYADWWQLDSLVLAMVWAVEFDSVTGAVVYQQFDRVDPLVAANTRYPVTLGAVGGGLGQAPRL